MINTRRAFVIGCYKPTGGAYMAYHLARILQLDFSFKAITIQIETETPAKSVFRYDPTIPSMAMAEMEATINDDDVLIINPSFSHHMFGLRVAGRKISYVQGFNTFKILDCRFERYVAASGFVSGFLVAVYGLRPNVIPPFIGTDGVAAEDWWSRPAGSTLVYTKGPAAITELFLERLKSIVASRGAPVDFDHTLSGKLLQHPEMMRRIGSCRHLLALSIAEGFGLVPLEAMALGTTVIGFDGFGGREYMRPDFNCATESYPNIEVVANNLVDLARSPERAAELALAGRATANLYTYDRFRSAWIREFSDWLEIEPTSSHARQKVPEDCAP